MCVLSDVENANILGRLLAHEHKILDRIVDPDSAAPFLKITTSFRGTITQLAMDPCPDPFRHEVRDNVTTRTDPTPRGRPHLRPYVPLAQRVHLSSKERNHLEVED